MQHIARLYIKGILYFLLATAILYHGVAYVLVPKQPDELVLMFVGQSSMAERTYLKLLAAYLHTSKPWPQNYAAWLFDTDPPAPRSTQDKQPMYITIPGTQLKGHGILTGDLGYSVEINRAMTAVDMYGEGLWLLPLLALAATLGLSLLALLKMRRRGRAHALQEDTPHIELYSENYAAREALAQALRVQH